jgi:hypothetical protein
MTMLWTLMGVAITFITLILAGAFKKKNGSES